MPPDTQKQPSNKTLYSIIVYVVVFFVLVLISYSAELSAFLIGILDLFRPIILGLVIAYLCNPVFRFLERKVFFRLRPPALRRVISLLLTYLFYFVIIAAIILLLLPQLVESIFAFILNYEAHVKDAIANINGVLEALNGFLGQFIGKNDFFEPISDSQFFAYLYNILTDPENGLISYLDTTLITNAAGAFVGVFTDTIFALFISIYLLASKEKRYAQVMKLRRALFGNLTNKRITKICTTANESFGKFIQSKVIDSVIIGILLYIPLSVLAVPYAILISATIGIFSLVPIIGFLIGLLVSAFLVLLTDAAHLLPFLITAFIIYQIDVNIITPKLIGTNTGVSTLCVMVSICIMGNMWGLVGMIIAVPFAVTLLELTDSIFHQRLQKKRKPDDVENYYAPDPIVDPIHGIPLGRGRLVKKLIKTVLHANLLINSGCEDQLRRRDRMALRIYAVARKLRILKEMSPDSITQFSAEEAVRNAQIKNKAMCTEYAAYTPQSVTNTAPITPTDEITEGGMPE